jgi:hypothetical protein
LAKNENFKIFMPQPQMPANRHKERLAKRQIKRQRHSYEDRLRNKGKENQTDKETEGQKSRQIKKQRERKADR